MQVNFFLPISNTPSLTTADQTAATNRKAYQPRFARLDPPLKKLRIDAVVQQNLTRDPLSGTTALHIALKRGEYDTALAQIKQHIGVDVSEYATGFTPLHCLCYYPWNREHFFNLLSLLLKKGCASNAKSHCNSTFLDCLARSWNFKTSDYKEIFKLIAGSNHIFYHPHQELPLFLLKCAATPNTPVSERIDAILSYFSYIPVVYRQSAAEKLFFQLLSSHQYDESQLAELIEKLLEGLRGTFIPALARDSYGGNLIQAYLIFGNPFSNPKEKARIVKTLKENGVDIHNCHQGDSLFQNIIRLQWPFQMKKELLQQLLNVGISWSVSVRTYEEIPHYKPDHVMLIEYLLTCSLPGHEISDLVQIYYKNNWYREYLLLKLIANCFSSNSEWRFTYSKVSLTGALTSWIDFYHWLETESKQFYGAVTQSGDSLESLLRQVESLVNEEAKKLIQQIDPSQWNPILRETGELLSRAYCKNFHANSPLPRHKNGELLALIPSLRTTKINFNHMIGLLFKPGEILFCNKGDDLTKRAGISRHSRPQEKIDTIFQEAVRGVNLYPFIREHFPERIEDEAGKESPYVVSQKPQATGNCPVASLSSLEFGILITLIQQALPEADQNSIVEIAKNIKKVHRLERRKTLIREYELFHQQEGLGLPSYLPFMNNLRLEALKEPILRVNQEEKDIEKSVPLLGSEDK
ncbi:ankyrin repeat domain-containing protein [Estrella lausannensis]|uniref:Uncharacterized protein n=1 Tax=Estrella lausannensis TaxID=483423 RepID=A0A0H5E882_9BACT|nr:ankyrin repeat domain-containing protein [Estrella lausannensis]CRX39560.1 hypothetical protein ELAC_2240 [Estrella lausannensis]